MPESLMRTKTFRRYDQDTLLVMPPSVRDWVDAESLPAFISDLVDDLDLRPFLAAHDEPRGMPPYHPAMMLKVLLYGYAIGVTSSRKLEERLRSDVGFMFLAGQARGAVSRILLTANHRISMVLAALAIAATVVACEPAPGASVESIVADQLTVVFNVGDRPQSYVAFGTASMRIADSDLTRIGSASSADPSVFPDGSVFALAGVDPRDAIVLIDQSGATTEFVLFTHDGISPPSVPGVCGYYASPDEVGCP